MKEPKREGVELGSTASFKNFPIKTLNFFEAYPRISLTHLKSISQNNEAWEYHLYTSGSPEMSFTLQPLNFFHTYKDHPYTLCFIHNLVNPYINRIRDEEIVLNMMDLQLN